MNVGAWGFWEEVSCRERMRPLYFCSVVVCLTALHIGSTRTEKQRTSIQASSKESAPHTKDIALAASFLTWILISLSSPWVVHCWLHQNTHPCTPATTNLRKLRTTTG